MMILNLNLLSPNKKMRNEHVTRFLFVKHLLEISLLVAACLATALLLSWLLLQQLFNNLSLSSILVNSGTSTFNKEVRQINKINHEINTSAQNYAIISPKLLDLIQITTNEIKLNSIDWDTKTGKLVIDGTAKTRDILLAYQSAVKTISWVGSIETPTSELFQKENINFELTIMIKKEK